ncbi:MAG TPA: hypothetical protein HA256_05465 [Methanoregulaceae archaeon]|nr:hypothetical protein [Methanoregulaceae archaeon]
METGQSIHDLVVAKGMVSEEEADRLFDLTAISANRYRNQGGKKPSSGRPGEPESARR